MPYISASPIESSEAGRKDDQHKPRVGLVPTTPLLDVAAVLTYGARKYDEHNWRRGIKYSRLYDAALRHLLAFIDGEDTDQESGLPHLAHAACELLMLMEMGRIHPNLDDRYKKG